jgi:16S rRNA (guanine527-N7)-methyltransferase
MTDSQGSTDSLAEALRQQGIELPAGQIEQLDAYCRLLWDWNLKLNLTRHVDYQRFVSRDVVDTLALARLLEPREEVLDVGSGGGVPGIPLAIVRPDLTVSLSESVGKKAQALHAIVASLGLPISVHHCRAEEVLDQFRFDTLVARAVGPLIKILRWVQPYWSSFQRILAVKGPRWQEEAAEVARQRAMRQLTVRSVLQYAMPGTESESVILEIRRKLAPNGIIRRSRQE